MDVLLYDKVRWEHEHYERALLDPIRAALRRRGLSAREARYGAYREKDFHAALAQCKSMICLCERKTQGIALNGDAPPIGRSSLGRANGSRTWLGIPIIRAGLADGGARGAKATKSRFDFGLRGYEKHLGIGPDTELQFAISHKGDAG